MTFIIHTGTPHDGAVPHSGRYPWGSGINPKQRPKDFVDMIDGLRKEGLSDADIATGLGMKQSEMKNRYFVARVNALGKQGMSSAEIAAELGMSIREYKSFQFCVFGLVRVASKDSYFQLLLSTIFRKRVGFRTL